jgi:hypothetical protein
MAQIPSYEMKTGKLQQIKREKDMMKDIVKCWKYYNHQVRKHFVFLDTQDTGNKIFIPDL